ncbi:MAG TPA: 2-C-methyl-D-erythritol 2,4-cyclodiphosphate synthase [Clostridiales bacterium]|nr:2-C-methyl-D-erythritol 2,4-cyclodiphosphate synthase [Clostridiales bacterium]
MEPTPHRTGLGQDSHAFEPVHSQKPLLLGGVIFPGGIPGLQGNSDADVVLHALTHAISGITGINILGNRADELCRSGITDSAVYVEEALSHLSPGLRILHVSFSIECARPRITPMIPAMRQRIANILHIREDRVGITATSGEGLTPFGQGLGIQVFCIVTAG